MSSSSGHCTQPDWTWYFWDMRTKGNLTAAEIIDLVDEADFHDWSDTGPAADRPYQRMRDAATTVGVFSEHLLQDSNGQDRQ